MPYYLCKYGHVQRVSDKVANEDDAAFNTFGLRKVGQLVSRVSCIKLPKSWKYMTVKQKQEAEAQVNKLHKDNGYESL